MVSKPRRPFIAVAFTIVAATVFATFRAPNRTRSVTEYSSPSYDIAGRFGTVEQNEPSPSNRALEGRRRIHFGSSRIVEDFDPDEFYLSLEATRQRFSSLYGGDAASSKLLQENVLAFSDRELARTAERLLSARAANRPFVVSFAGYSVTTGRGNMHNMSFPFILENILTKPLKLLGVEMVSRNAGLGGMNSLPYGWCLKNFLGSDADLVSWDFRFNEGSDSVSFESFLRHSMLMPKGSPKFVLMARRSASRKGVLRDYVRRGWQVDPIVIDNTYPPENKFLDLEDEQRPPGFQDFESWGAPEGSPGQMPWHPKYKWHMMIGWILGMHILQAADVAAQMLGNSDEVVSPPPLNGTLPSPTNDAMICDLSGDSSLLFGEPIIGDTEIQWFMPNTMCSTTFSPTVEGVGLSDLVISGLIAEDDVSNETQNMMGWVLGYGSQSSREEHNQYVSLGFRDSKVSMHGFATNGPLKLWLPWNIDEVPEAATSRRLAFENANDERATSWFKHITVCSFYGGQDISKCSLERDVRFLVGGKEASRVRELSAVGTEWMNKNLCVMIGIPAGARTSTREQVGSSAPGEEDDVGVVLSVEITNFDLVPLGATCSISHVVWQQFVE